MYLLNEKKVNINFDLWQLYLNENFGQMATASHGRRPREQPEKSPNVRKYVSHRTGIFAVSFNSCKKCFHCVMLRVHELPLPSAVCQSDDTKKSGKCVDMRGRWLMVDIVHELPLCHKVFHFSSATWDICHFSSVTHGWQMRGRRLPLSQIEWVH